MDAAVGTVPPARPGTGRSATRTRRRQDDTKENAVAETYNGYCVKCREKRDFSGEITETNGRRMAKGTCPVCGTRMTRILGKSA